MRGQAKTVKSLFLSGNVYLKYEDEEALETPEKGDICLYLNTENTDKTRIKGDYFRTGYAGYYKAEIFDGKEWQFLNVNDFCEHKEHYFSKSERSFDTYTLCSEFFRNAAGAEVFKGYRGGHYSLHQYVPGVYKGKKGHM
jgi:hypothetical protein